MRTVGMFNCVIFFFSIRIHGSVKYCIQSHCQVLLYSVFCASSYAIGQTKKDRLYLQALVVQRVGAGVCLPLPEQTSHDAVRRKSPGSTTYAERRSAADGSRARFISGSCGARARARAIRAERNLIRRQVRVGEDEIIVLTGSAQFLSRSTKTDSKFRD